MASPSFTRRRAPAHNAPVSAVAVDTTCEGVWLLQALCGVELLPSPMLLRPYVGAGGVQYDHPGIPVLREAGVLIGDDEPTVHPTVARWIETLGAPDIALCVDVRRGGEFMRLVIARRDEQHVAISRSGAGDGDDVTIEAVGTVPSMRVLYERVMELCERGAAPVEPARFEPITVRSAEFIAGLGDVARDDHTPAQAFRDLALTAEQRRLVMLAVDTPALEVGFGLLVHDARGDHVALASAAVTDTVEGRIVTGPVRGDDGTWWTQMVPGTSDAGGSALRSLMATMGVDWSTHNRFR
ncbi:ESX secretion-associated protein EspG [Mycolicibacterium arenosum]|uniref:ESX secretion-associated protein EspG n=1 Tax=Mycolicibacterium arenosum TaxID=2952157 RepID=A0ABT1MCL2_9MYCO|nr:ESX secretion-associated protein EspG [Mycolicibacterium sp. CAU 1645]MCP9276913.1 ESX secretion-associated protein EspG [Mycolicibacterium sp. CAU 1645]